MISHFIFSMVKGAVRRMDKKTGIIYKQRFSQKALKKHKAYFLLFKIRNGYINDTPRHYHNILISF